MEPYFKNKFCEIYHGDSLELFQKILAKYPIKCLVTDPPYGFYHYSKRNGKFHRQPIANDEDTSARDIILNLSKRVGLMWAVFGNLKSILTGYKGVLVWDKGERAGMGDFYFPWKPNFELIFIGGQGWIGKRTSSVLQINSVNDGTRHPNEKPVHLLKEIIKKIPSDYIIIDPFMGSGTTLVAAQELGRNCIGIELEEKYCEMTMKRLAFVPKQKISLCDE